MWRRTSIFLLVAGLLVMATSTEAAMYVSDQVRLPVRSGTSLKNRIIKMVPTGTALEVLQEASEGYYKIRLPGGTEGYILSRYLMDQPSARSRLAQIEPKLEELREVNAQLREREQALSQEVTALKSQNQELVAKNQSLSEELQEIRRTSSRALELRRENARLTQEMAQQKQALQREQRKNERLQATSDRKWFVTGAGVTLLSLFLGLIIPRIPWRRRRRWGEL